RERFAGWDSPTPGDIGSDFSKGTPTVAANNRQAGHTYGSPTARRGSSRTGSGLFLQLRPTAAEACPRRSSQAELGIAFCLGSTSALPASAPRPLRAEWA